MKHQLRRRPSGRLQCLECRAGFRTAEAARHSVFACPGEGLAHGPTGAREHLVYPKDLDRSCRAWNCPDPAPEHRWHGPDPYCDEYTCSRCMHDCDCDVCKGVVHVPRLNVLVDIPEDELNLTPRRKRARMKNQLAELRVNDYVKAEGVDTRGHKVVRVGDLLAPPKNVTAQRNGKRVKGWRLFVGLPGTPVTERSTWVTLFPDAGSVERTSRPQQGEWSNTELRYVPGVRANNHNMAIYFGGKGGKRSKEPAEPVVLAGITYTDDGHYEIWDKDTRDVLLTCTLQTQIWWATAPPPTQEEEASEPAQRGFRPQLSVVAGNVPDEADDLGKPVSHVRTGKIVGYLLEPQNGQDWQFTPIGERAK
ncbi:hypothetical protein AB0I84_07425 [Streptomyces spectabilis]|uniref:hypothetical protein n=1 Tax=Streptomyces spectabilis TaxID=68270 RepID=UPI0033F32744